MENDIWKRVAAKLTWLQMLLALPGFFCIWSCQKLCTLYINKTQHTKSLYQLVITLNFLFESFIVLTPWRLTGLSPGHSFSGSHNPCDPSIMETLAPLVPLSKMSKQWAYWGIYIWLCHQRVKISNQHLHFIHQLCCLNCSLKQEALLNCSLINCFFNLLSVSKELI